MSKCKYLSDDFDEFCTNADCPLLADFCPWDNHKEDCRYAEMEEKDDRERTAD